MSAYSDLMEYVRQTEALSEVAERLGWDQQAMMPPGAGAQRGEEMAAMEAILHARRSDPKLGDWLEKAEGEETGQVEKAQLRHIRFSYDRTVKMPADLATEYARATSLGQQAWESARHENDFAGFAPTLKNIVSLSREQADAWAQGGDRYDALLQGYEPGTTGDEIAQVFDAMRTPLVALRERVLGADTPKELTGNFDEEKQMILARRLAKTFGYDFNHGRMDKVVHPFMSGSGLDVRVTTRTSSDAPFDCFYSTVHEVGHAAYEQNIDKAYMLSPLGNGVSMGVHESQSRIYENQLGRGRAFTSWLYTQMIDVFGDFGVNDQETFYKLVNRVSPGYIRTEADEIHYNLHIMMRFDLERALISGDLEVEDLPGAWNERFERDFGQVVDCPANGVLQDVHWSVGAIGYFPTYALGNVYAGCLYEKMKADVPGFDADLAKGDTSRPTAWLAQNVQQHGGLYEPRNIIENASGAQISEKPLIAYLEEKYSDLYDL